MKIKSMFILLIILLSNQLSAEPSFTVKNDKGVRIVTNQNRAADSTFSCGVKLLAQLTKEKVSRYKLLDIMQEVGAKNIKQVKADSRNCFYFLGDNKIIKLNQNLEFITQWGKIGSGPGEFKGAYDFFIYQDTVFVNDQNRAQLLRFDTNGKYINSKFTDFNGDLSRYNFHGIIANLKNGFVAPVSHCYDYELKTNTSHYTDQIAVFNNYLQKTKVLFERKISRTVTDWPFFLTTAGKKEFAVVENDYNSYQINVYDINSGKVTTKIRRGFKKIENPDHQVRYSQASTKNGALTIKNKPSEFLEPVQKLFYDQNNRLWVQVNGNSGPGEVVFDIFMNGILMKKLSLPWDKTYLQVKMFGNKLLLMDVFTLEADLYEIY